MLKRRQINAKYGRRRLRSWLAAASMPFRDLAGVVEEHVVWRIADLLRRIADFVKWTFERLAWGVERGLIWPLRERAAGWGPPSRVAGAAALAAVALAAGAAGVVSISGGDSGGEVGVPIAAKTATAPAQLPPEKSASPKLEGVPPSFGTGGVAAAGGESGDVAVESSEPDATAAPAAASGEEEGAAATSSSGKPVPAGPAAMKVARRFAEAFVFYEIGKRPARAETVFTETATPRLAAALAERPPRLPENAEVPKARVLNLVPGPRRGRAYTVSASLLRVGVTSELRLRMTTRKGAWLVTDVRG